MSERSLDEERSERSVERDSLAEARDARGDERDDLATARDTLARQRDQYAKQRERAARHRLEAAAELSASSEDVPQRVPRERKAREKSYEQALVDREVAQSEVAWAQQELSDFLEDARGMRRAVERDRSASQSDRSAAAEDRRAAAQDRISSAADRDQAEVDSQLLSPSRAKRIRRPNES